MRGRFCAYDFVSLDDCGDTDARVIAIRPFIDSHHLAHRANEDLRPASDFRGQRQRDVQFRARTQILVNRKINTACGDVACFAASRGYFFFHWHANDDR